MKKQFGLTLISGFFLFSCKTRILNEEDNASHTKSFFKEGLNYASKKELKQNLKTSGPILKALYRIKLPKGSVESVSSTKSDLWVKPSAYSRADSSGWIQLKMDFVQLSGKVTELTEKGTPNKPGDACQLYISFPSKDETGSEPLIRFSLNYDTPPIGKNNCNSNEDSEVSVDSQKGVLDVSQTFAKDNLIQAYSSGSMYSTYQGGGEFGWRKVRLHTKIQSENGVNIEVPTKVEFEYKGTILDNECQARIVCEF